MIPTEGSEAEVSAHDGVAAAGQGRQRAGKTVGHDAAAVHSQQLDIAAAVSCFSFRSGFPFTFQSRFASVSPSASRLHPVTIHFRFLFSPPFHVCLSVPVFLLPPLFLFAVLPRAFFPVPSFTFSTFLPSSVTSSMFRLINSSTSDSL